MEAAALPARVNARFREELNRLVQANVSEPHVRRIARTAAEWRTVFDHAFSPAAAVVTTSVAPPTMEDVDSAGGDSATATAVVVPTGNTKSFHAVLNALHHTTFNAQFVTTVCQEILRVVMLAALNPSKLSQSLVFEQLSLILKQLTHVSNSMGNQRLACDDISLQCFSALFTRLCALSAASGTATTTTAAASAAGDAVYGEVITQFAALSPTATSASAVPEWCVWLQLWMRHLITTDYHSFGRFCGRVVIPVWCKSNDSRVVEVAAHFMARFFGARNSQSQSQSDCIFDRMIMSEHVRAESASLTSTGPSVAVAASNPAGTGPAALLNTHRTTAITAAADILSSPYHPPPLWCTAILASDDHQSPNQSPLFAVLIALSEQQIATGSKAVAFCLDTITNSHAFITLALSNPVLCYKHLLCKLPNIQIAQSLYARLLLHTGTNISSPPHQQQHTQRDEKQPQLTGPTATDDLDSVDLWSMQYRWISMQLSFDAAAASAAAAKAATPFSVSTAASGGASTHQTAGSLTGTALTEHFLRIISPPLYVAPKSANPISKAAPQHPPSASISVPFGLDALGRLGSVVGRDVLTGIQQRLEQRTALLLKNVEMAEQHVTTAIHSHQQLLIAAEQHQHRLAAAAAAAAVVPSSQAQTQPTGGAGSQSTDVEMDAILNLDSSAPTRPHSTSTSSTGSVSGGGGGGAASAFQHASNPPAPLPLPIWLASEWHVIAHTYCHLTEFGSAPSSGSGSSSGGDSTNPTNATPVITSELHMSSAVHVLAVNHCLRSDHRLAFTRSLLRQLHDLSTLCLSNTKYLSLVPSVLRMLQRAVIVRLECLKPFIESELLHVPAASSATASIAIGGRSNVGSNVLGASDVRSALWSCLRLLLSVPIQTEAAASPPLTSLTSTQPADSTPGMCDADPPFSALVAAPTQDVDTAMSIGDSIDADATTQTLVDPRTPPPPSNTVSHRSVFDETMSGSNG